VAGAGRRPAVPPSPAELSRPGSQRRRHVFRGQRERPAAPGGAAQAGGRRGAHQGDGRPGSRTRVRGPGGRRGLGGPSRTQASEEARRSGPAGVAGSQGPRGVPSSLARRLALGAAAWTATRRGPGTQAASWRPGVGRCGRVGSRAGEAAEWTALVVDGWMDGWDESEGERRDAQVSARRQHGWRCHAKGEMGTEPRLGSVGWWAFPRGPGLYGQKPGARGRWV
jgi:hypothetical protein